ncbi:hypothetical protein [Dyadobacter psychrophilus]|uniref:Uncharacterized protein n=1 Tax=Dyadobacter psychrophilus TaxID=651661 RepID=A0A1T5BPI4_9BACT|nr:hypothetical protein [Dyadobacter psychrophilus]SKB48820.1 hypothetical protein SAMN05660293_00487 [Dyadobacter psychrophilus]
MATQSNKENVEGGSPTHGGPKGKEKQKDDSAKPSKTLSKEAVKESEQENMTGKKGYNETPPTVPVKSTKQ